MSLNFEKPVNSEALAKIVAQLGEPAAKDDKTLLFNQLPTLNGRSMSDIARTAGQVMTIECHGEGEIKTLADGTRYQCSKNGWTKLES